MEAATGKAKDVAEIERLVAEWSRAVESKDPEKIVANYGPETVLFDAIPPARTVGARDIGRIWAECMPHFPDKFRSEHKDLTIHVDGDLATVHALHHFVPEPPDHPSGATWMRVTVVFRRVAGNWRVVHEHVSIPFDPFTSRAVFIDGDANAIPAPSADTKLMPHLVCKGAAEAIEFYKKAFGAEEMMRLPTPDGRLMHAAVMIGGNVVMLVDEFRDAGGNANAAPATLGGTPVTLHLQVSDVDALFKRATAAGAKSVMEPAEMFWGDRYGVVEDPFGHRWSLATTVKTLSPQDLQKAAADAMLKGPGC
jgi:PhnB protein